MGQENDSEDVRQKLVYHLLFQLAQQIASFAVFHKYIQLLYQIGSRFLR